MRNSAMSAIVLLAVALMLAACAGSPHEVLAAEVCEAAEELDATLSRVGWERPDTPEESPPMYGSDGRMTEEFAAAVNRSFEEPPVSDPAAVRAAISSYEDTLDRVRLQAVADDVNYRRVDAQTRLTCESALANYWTVHHQLG